jgi:hypothetical protein
MNREELVQRAAQIARAKGDLAKRLAAYRDVLHAAKDEDPACPDCWIERQDHLAMTPIACETQDEVQFGCMECGFEASFPARTARYWTYPDRHRKRPRAA